MLSVKTKAWLAPPLVALVQNIYIIPTSVGCCLLNYVPKNRMTFEAINFPWSKGSESITGWLWIKEVFYSKVCIPGQYQLQLFWRPASSIPGERVHFFCETELSIEVWQGAGWFKFLLVFNFKNKRCVPLCFQGEGLWSHFCLGEKR